LLTAAGARKRDHVPLRKVLGIRGWRLPASPVPATCGGKPSADGITAVASGDRYPMSTRVGLTGKRTERVGVLV